MTTVTIAAYHLRWLHMQGEKRFETTRDDGLVSRTATTFCTSIMREITRDVLLEPKIFPTWDISLGRTLLKFRRRRPQTLLSSGTIQNFPRFNHLALELEIYLQGNKVVYANDSLERQDNLLRTINGLSELWLQTNFVHRVLFYDAQWPSEGLPTHRIKSREIHGYMRGHRLLEALGGSVHVFQGLDGVFHGYNEEGNQEGRRRDIVVRMRHFLRDMRDNDYAIIVGSYTESQWMPLEWKNNLPGKPAKFWSHGSSIYDEEEDKPDALSNEDHWGNIARQNLVPQPGKKKGISAMIKLLRRRTFSKDEGNLDHGPGKLEVVHHPSPAVIDIIAVHGLTHGFKSWTWENKRHNWLEAALARENCGKNARIMTYSYQSNLSKPQVDLRTVLRSRAHDMIYQISELRRKDNTSTRPLVFVAHSLGGLLVKQGLIYSANATKPELRNVEILTGGIAFFGTPNDDIDPGSLATIIKKIISLSSDLENWLKGNDAELDNEAKWLQEDLGAFKPIRSRMKILRVFESKPTSFRGESKVFIDHEKIVSDTGSFKEMEHEQKVVLQRKHTGLVKFGGSDDQEYSKLREQFAQLLAEAQNRAKKKLEDSQIPDGIRTLPFQLPPLNQFRGPRDEIIIRHELTEKMHRLLKEERSTEDFNTMVVHGPPGTGKTTLVRDYSDQRAARDEFVFWMNAENQHTMIRGYLNLLQVIIDNYNATQGAKYPANARSKVELVMGMLRPQALLDRASEKLMSPVEIQSVIMAAMNLLMAAESWLLVFDNVRPGFNLLEFVPLSRHGQLILISEDRAHCPWGDSIEIQAWNDQEAADLFNKLMDHSKFIQEHPPSTGVFSFSGSESKQLIDQLGCQPMVITSAAKHIQATKQTPSAFLSSVSRSSLFLETLGLSLTRRVLEVCSVLSSDAVPYRLLKLVAERYHVIHGTDLSTWSLADVLEKLQDQSVILRVSGPDDDHEKGGNYVLHQNARQWIKETWVADEQQELRSVWVASYCCTKLLRLQKSPPATKESEKSMIPHAMACYQMSGRIKRNNIISRDDDEFQATIEWQVFGKLFMRQGLRGEAIECFKLALENMSQMDAREQVETRFDLISLYQKDGKIDDCKIQLQQIDIDKVNLKDAGLNRRVELAWAIEAVAEGELEIAEERYQKLGKSQEHDLDPIDTDAIFTVHRLGVILKRLGKMDDAEAKYEQALLSYKIVLGDYNAVTLEAAEELAQILQLRGAFEGAQNHFEWTIDIKRKTLGGQHPSTALSIAKFAALCDMKGDFARADERYEEAFGIMEQSLGCSHPMYLAAMENQALSYRKRANQLFTLTEQGDRQGKESQGGKEKPYSQDYKRAASILSAVIDRKSRNREFYKEASIRATQAKLTKMYETESYFKGATGFSQSAYLAPEDRIDNHASRID